MLSEARRFLDQATPPGYRNVYVIASDGKMRINVASQQARAFNLAWALRAEERVSAGTRVWVFGAGACGLSCAAALRLFGAQVRVFDRAYDAMHFQFGCHHRFLHPRINEWPAEHAIMASANLPILDWYLGSAHDVREQILRGYRSIVGGEQAHEKIESFRVEPDGWVAVDPPRPGDEQPAFVVLCLGFGIERAIDKLPRLSYWRLDALDQPGLDTTDDPRTILVNGVGDGGAVDFLRAALRSFDHGPVLDHVCELLETARADIVDIERDAAALAGRLASSSHDANAIDNALAPWLLRRYEAWFTHYKAQTPQDWQRLCKFLREEQRAGVKVDWAGLSPTCMRYRTQPLHRLLAWLILRLKEKQLAYLQADPARVTLLDPTRLAGPQYEVVFKPLGSAPAPDPRRYHQVVNRTGGENPLKRGVPEIQAALEQRKRSLLIEDDDRLRPEADQAIRAALAQVADKVGEEQAPSFKIAKVTPVDDLRGERSNLVCYRIRLHLEGDLEDVSWVEYRLHSRTPAIQRRALRGPGDAFAVSLFTWNDYEVESWLSDGRVIGPTSLKSLTKDLRDLPAKLKDPEKALVQTRAHRVRTGSLLKEKELAKGLVESLFRPCASTLVKLFDAPKQGARILDAGCGSGIVAECFQGAATGGAIVHAFDNSAEAIAVANEPRNPPVGGLTFWVDDAVTVQQARPPYQAIFAQHLLQHLQQAGVAVQALRRWHALLEQQGTLIACVWTPNCPAYQAIYTACGEWDEKRGALGMEPDALAALVKSGGFRVMRSEGMEIKQEVPLLALVEQYMLGTERWLTRGYTARCEVLRQLENGAETPSIGVSVVVASPT